MSAINDLFSSKLEFINIGTPSFAEDLAAQGQDVINLKWQPPTIAPALLEALDAFADDPEIEAANKEAADRIMS